jgi:hypothetical protein
MVGEAWLDGDASQGVGGAAGGAHECGLLQSEAAHSADAAEGKIWRAASQAQQSRV